MDKELRILMLEDVATDAELIERELRKGGIAFSSRRVQTKEAFLKEVMDFAPDIILADYSLPQFDGISALAIAQKQCPDVPFILVSGAIGEEIAIEALKCGATDYVLKQRLLRLLPSVRRALREVEERAERRRAEKALKESEEQFRTVVEASLDAIIAVNEHGNIVLFNPAAEELFLHSSEEVLNKPIKILFRENAAEAHQNRLERFLSIGMGQCGHIGRRLERTFKRKDGTLFEAEVAMTGGRRDGNRLIVVSIHDVTERKRAERALQESQVRYRDLVETIEDWIWEVDADGVYTYVSPRVHDILGYEPEELIGKTPFDIMTPEESKRVGNIFSGLVSAQKPLLSLENTNIHKDGQLVVLETSGKPFFDADGTLLGYRGVDRDITERKRAKELLEQLRRQNELILNSAGEGILGLDLQGKHTFVNPSAARMLGYEVEELIGQPSHGIWHHTKTDGSPYPKEECPIYAAYKDGSVYHVRDDVFWKKDGISFPVEYTSTPILEEGKLVGAVITFKDIIEHKQADEALRKSGEELKKRVKELEEFYNMAVGRELKMIELKKEIEGLKEELKKYKES